MQSAKFCSANLNSYVTAEKMALLRYLKRKRQDDEITLPRVEDCNSASISKKELEAANKEVKKILLSKGESKARGKYNVYTSEERAAIGKYAAENGAARASRHFPKVFGNVNESTARRLKVEYLQKVKETKTSVTFSVKHGVLYCMYDGSIFNLQKSANIKSAKC